MRFKNVVMKVAVMAAVAAGAAAGADFNAETVNNGKSVRIRSGVYHSSGGTLRIPSHIRGLPVTSIGDRAFQYRVSAIGNKYTGVIISEGVAEIGDRAFYGHDLTNVTIPSSVIAIGVEAFAVNNSLIMITIGANVHLGRKNEGAAGEYRFSRDYAAFPDNFDEVYNQAGRAAGTYIKQNGKWSKK